MVVVGWLVCTVGIIIKTHSGGGDCLHKEKRKKKRTHTHTMIFTKVLMGTNGHTKTRNNFFF